MLHIEHLDVNVGDKGVLRDINLDINEGETHVLLGPNGSGKTTLLMTIMGFSNYTITRGKITFKGEGITGRKAYLLVRLGMAYVPDDRRVFADLTVDDNLELSFRRSDAWNKERVYELFPALAEMKSRRAGNLSGGEQQMLTIGRALMSSPELLLLDEPTEGLAPLIVRDLEEQTL